MIDSELAFQAAQKNIELTSVEAAKKVSEDVLGFINSQKQQTPEHLQWCWYLLGVGLNIAGRQPNELGPLLGQRLDRHVICNLDTAELRLVTRAGRESISDPLPITAWLEYGSGFLELSQIIINNQINRRLASTEVDN